jgi:murein DD-endopeptidase MepM/ murein hydrolase activator NlpD
VKIAQTIAQTPHPSIPGGIEALRGRKDPEALRAVAREMESLFAYEMVKAMRATAGGAASGKGFGGDVYGSLFDMELARVISSRGLGLQEILLRGIGGGKPTGTEVKGPTRGETANAPEPSGDLHGMPPEARTKAPPAPAVENVPSAPPPPEIGTSASPAPVVENVPSAPPPLGSGFPIRDGGRVSSGFGFRKDPFTGGIAFHRGMDIAAAAGTAVHPVREGKVTFSGHQKGYGNVVIVDHGDGFVTKYGHNRANLVDTGALVGPDTVIAEVGGTGRSTGPHLHFEVTHGGENVRPETVLAGIAKENG